MALDTITLNNGVIDEDYALQSQTAKSAIFRNVNSTLANPQTCEVAHTITTEVNGTDRHLIRLARTANNDEGIPRTVTAHVVLTLPRDTGGLQTKLELEWVKLKDVVDTFIDEILGGFYPGS
jgi:hypothetical protein